MLKPPIIPRLVRVKLCDYNPLFSDTIEFEIKHEQFLILGGNGLGKTTILQSIIYCIAGEADSDIEKEKSNRWGRQFFHGRLDDPDKALIEVDFYINNEKITVTRGFQTKNLKRLACNDIVISENSSEAEAEYEKCLKEYAHFNSLVDFRYLIHRLCYLSENRENIVWDIDVQVRLMMLLFQDIIPEAEFRRKREILKELDSGRRHVNVAINKVTGRLETFYEYDESKVDDSEEESIEPDENQDSEELTVSEEEQKRRIFEQLGQKVDQRKFAQREINNYQKEVSDLTSEIEVIQEKVAHGEEQFILRYLTQIESQETKLVIHKLIYRKHCPACGSIADDLGEQAYEYSIQGRCPICGSMQSIEPTEEIQNIDGQLSELIRIKTAKEQELIISMQKLESIIEDEAELQNQFDYFRLKEPIISLTYKAALGEKEKLEGELSKLKDQYSDYQLRFDNLQSELQEKYILFQRQSEQRMAILRELYQSYASQFLGIECELVSHPSEAKFLELDLYVPKFAGKYRANPHTCSESQKFFLDIAFRMAMVNLAKRLSDSPGSFICETPESALDLAYIDNVAEMFKIFAKQGHNIISTSNLQPGSLAKPILGEYTREQRLESTLNLMDYGLLTDVQKDKLPELQKQLENILG